VWQQKFEKYGSDSFTIVGLALDAEGIAPAKIYYDRFGVTFPTLVDPDYATQFGAVPKTFFIDEYGVVQNARNWEQQLAQLADVRPLSDEVQSKWSQPDARLSAAAIRKLSAVSSKMPKDPGVATQLASRYAALGLHAEARRVLFRVVQQHDAKSTAKSGGQQAQLLGQVDFQLSRCCVGDRQKQVEYATQSFYLNPTIGFGKQIARIIAPEKFDGRPEGDFDNIFREATLTRLKSERAEWLSD
jgi:hypothetical protein